MLAYLNGKVIAKLDGKIIVKVPSGVGYLVNISNNDNYLVNENVEFFLLYVVSNEIPELYGFKNIDERNWVEKLLKVNGVGPKMAAKIVYALGVDLLSQALMKSDVGILSQVKGLGSKTAKKILLELKGSELGDLEKTDVNLKNVFTIDFVDTLSGLGYKRGEIVNLISILKRKNFWDESNLVETVRKGLTELGR
jgi:Holliday junction DNA helicase RuvA